jgi:uncharacterized protein YacL
MPVIMRLMLIVFASFSGFFILRQLTDNEGIAYAGFVSGTLIALAALKFEDRVNETPLRVVAGGAIGLILGLVVANLLTYPLALHFLENPYLELSTYLFMNCVVGYLGLSIGMEKGGEFKGIGARLGNFNFSGEPVCKKLVVDTNVIIDGRIAEISETGFLDATLIVPQFVIGEIQYIADSQDNLKKVRGKRGLDILSRLKKDDFVEVEVTDEDFPDTKEVDLKLVALAKKNKANILTNDINLTKVAELNSVKVLNINALASSLKPVIMPGETLALLVQKEGREHGQGVGYLDDGTMIVIDNASSLIGKTTQVEVTSILQTTSGRMIFAMLRTRARN